MTSMICPDEMQVLPCLPVPNDDHGEGHSVVGRGFSSESLAISGDRTIWCQHLSDVFRELERAADTFWQLADECAPLYTAYQNSRSDDVIKALKPMRKIHAISSNLLNDIEIFIRNAQTKKERFSKVVNGFGVHISQTALNYGINLLPDELLTKILFLAADKVKETVAFSHVCKRFRSCVLSSQTMWRRFTLRSSWDAEQILAFAERSGFHGLSGYIGPVDGSPYLGPSAKAVLSLHPYLEKLQLSELHEHSVEEAGHILSKSTMPDLHSLSIALPRHVELQPSSQFFDVWNMPSLQYLQVNFIPRPSWAINLVRCSVTLNDTSFHLKALLDLLSSAERLEALQLSIQLSISITQAASQSTWENLRPVPMKTLVALDVNCLCSRSVPYQGILRKLYPSALRRLKLHGSVSSATMLSYFMEASPFVRDLELIITPGGPFDLSGIFAAQSEHLETISIMSQVQVTFDWPHGSLAFKAHRLQCICFKFVASVTRDLILSLRDFFRDKQRAVEFQFVYCNGVPNGTYTLDTVESAMRGE